MVKGVPLAYNKDFQEDKEPIFDTVEITSSCIKAMTILINEGLEFNIDKLSNSVENDFSNATDLADYLVRKQVPLGMLTKLLVKLLSIAWREKVV